MILIRSDIELSDCTIVMTPSKLRQDACSLSKKLRAGSVKSLDK
jgi:hypothetical protein